MTKLQRLMEAVAASLGAWDDEEDSVREEHASVIAELHAAYDAAEKGLPADLTAVGKVRREPKSVFWCAVSNVAPERNFFSKDAAELYLLSCALEVETIRRSM